MRSAVAAWGLTILLAGCSSLPHGYERLAWRDLRGDRGIGVAHRDLAWCSGSLETRRSLIRECMVEHGWIAQD